MQNRKLKNEELGRLSVDEFKSAEKIPLIIVLDNVRSLHNVGSVFRTADAFRLKRIVLCGYTGTPPNKEISKTALGATESVEWVYFPSTIEAVKTLREEGALIYAVEQATDAIKLHTVQRDSSKPAALIFGNEVYGVDQEIIDYADACIEIPQWGSKHSLNISISVGIVVWEFCRKNLAS
jgi:23S rRNA (guanosine2251-2'-O)-methyltransferase